MMICNSGNRRNNELQETEAVENSFEIRGCSADVQSANQVEECCTGTTGCDFDGSLRRVRAEPIYTQKVYDAALFNLQGLRSLTGVEFTPKLPAGSRIIRVLDIRCRKFFNPSNINDSRNLTIEPETTISGGQFVTDKSGDPVTVVGADGTRSETLIFADTTECDMEDRGTPIFGSQDVTISGNVVVEIDVLYTNDEDCELEVTLSANVDIGTLVLTNFFELCLPSVFNSAFLPRLAEICNVTCQSRLGNNRGRDIVVGPQGRVIANLIISLCATCEKKIIVPVQLCVLSTGFPRLSPIQDQVCSSFPQLFPNQIDENNNG